MGKDKCHETAKIILPWGGKLFKYCPVHANEIVLLGNAIGSPIQVEMLPAFTIIECESQGCLTEDQKELNKTFKPQ